MNTIVDVLLNAVEKLFSAYLNTFLMVFDKAFCDLAEVAFNMDTYLSSSIGLDFSAFYTAVYAFSIYLIVLKLLMKGFNVYILWNEGDSDMDPFILLTGFFKAIIIAISFNTIYSYGIKIPLELMNYVLGAINTVELDGSSIGAVIKQMTLGYYGVSILKILYTILYIMLWIQFIKRGFEIYVLKIGVSIACCGLMDSDGGVFRPYIKKIFQEIFTVLIQIFFLKVSLALMFNGNFLFGFAAISAAVNAPQFLQEFIVSYGGGPGIVSKTSQTIYMANMVRSFAK